VNSTENSEKKLHNFFLSKKNDLLKIRNISKKIFVKENVLKILIKFGNFYFSEKFLSNILISNNLDFYII